jgi:hypothetical protein
VSTDPTLLAAAEEIRARVDAMAPRVLPGGLINTQHVAMEATLRDRAALPAFVPELDGPGRFRPINYALTPTIDPARRGEAAITGWTGTCLRAGCGTAAQGQTVEQVGAWMAAHDQKHQA